MIVQIINKSANELPKYETKGSAGLDLRSNFETVIAPDKVALIPTGLFMEIPEGYEMQIRSRSGLSIKGIVVRNAPATIDSDFRGEIKVILHNQSESIFKVNIGDRIAQGVFNEVKQAHFTIAEALSDTERSNKGFGSTGFK